MDLRIGYSLLSAYYFLLDSVIDHHVVDHTAPLYLTHLLGASCLILSEVAERVGTIDKAWLHELLQSTFSSNAEAVRQEMWFRSCPLEPRELEEYDSIVNRANSFLLLYRLLVALSSRKPDVSVVKFMSDLIYYIQLGDDLTDWREDFAASRYTSLLRRCFARRGRVLSEQEVAPALYCSGILEQRAALVINGLDSLTAKADFSSDRLYGFVAMHRNHAYSLLRSWVTTKLELCRDYPS